jgi:hypothetical protein
VDRGRSKRLAPTKPENRNTQGNQSRHIKARTALEKAFQMLKEEKSK